LGVVDDRGTASLGLDQLPELRQPVAPGQPLEEERAAGPLVGRDPREDGHVRAQGEAQFSEVPRAFPLERPDGFCDLEGVSDRAPRGSAIVLITAPVLRPAAPPIPTIPPATARAGPPVLLDAP